MDIERSDMDILIWISKDLLPLFLRTINGNLPGLAFNELILNTSITPHEISFKEISLK